MIFNTESFEIFIEPWVLLSLGLSFSFLITRFAIPIIVKVAVLKNLMAIPNGRTSHTEPTPNMGGVAVFAGVILASVLFSSLASSHELKYIIAGMIIIFFVGVKDDLIRISPVKKLLGQLTASFFVIVPGNIRLTDLHGILGITEIGYPVSLVLTFIIFMVLINSFNLVDGIDGLASGIGILCSILFGLWFLVSGHVSYSVFSFAMVGSLAAFFWFNVFGKENKIFLGDTGSMLIGLLVAVFIVRFLEFEKSVSGIAAIQSAPAVALSVIIVPFFDAIRVFVLRVFRGSNPFRADKNHIHHRLLKLAGSHIEVTLTILLVNVLLIVLGYSLRGLGNELLILLLIALASVFSLIPVYLIRKHERL